MACPHTMKATDGDGSTYCCDCGKILRRALSLEAQQARRPPPYFAIMPDPGPPQPPAIHPRLAKAVRGPRRCVHGLPIHQECTDCNNVAHDLCGVPRFTADPA